jgi:hypothetical protein
MMISATEKGWQPVAVYARRALKPLAQDLKNAGACLRSHCFLSVVCFGHGPLFLLWRRRFVVDARHEPFCQDGNR